MNVFLTKKKIKNTTLREKFQIVFLSFTANKTLKHKVNFVKQEKQVLARGHLPSWRSLWFCNPAFFMVENPHMSHTYLHQKSGQIDQSRATIIFKCLTE